MTDYLCIYHKYCTTHDGFTAAWVVNDSVGRGATIEFFASDYNTPPPDAKGRHVIMVDFSYKKTQLLELSKNARSIMIIDHHKSSADELVSFPDVCTSSEDWHSICDMIDESYATIPSASEFLCPILKYFDQSHCGAVLTWKFFHPDIPIPSLFQYIEDADLGRMKDEYGLSVLSGMSTFPYDIYKWGSVIEMNPDKLRDLGEVIARNNQIEAKIIVEQSQRMMWIGLYHVPVVNAPRYLRNWVCREMYKDPSVPFAASYCDTKNGREFSLRSDNEHGVKVEPIAKAYGGGGHEYAAGMLMPFGWEGELPPANKE